MIEIENLSKSFVSKERKKRITVNALKNISLKILPGESVGLIGANGSGKSTLIKLIASLIKPDSGSITIGGFDTQSQDTQSKRLLGVLFGGDAGLYGDLTGYENIEYFGLLNGLTKEEVKTRIDSYMGFFNTQDYINRRVGKFSRGMKQKILFLRSVIHQPKVVILDEPSTGLDVQGIKEVSDFLAYCRLERNTIIISSHNMNEIINNCDKVIILKQGELVYFGQISNLVTDNNPDQLLSLMGVLAK